MGEVYRATDTRLDRTVAIKVLPEHLADDPQRRERFEREARAVSSLNHPHICTLHDVGEQDGVHYLVMELVEGETLQQRLEKGRLPLDQALEYAIQIADALDKAHRQGVVHRDLKPGNIMITKSGTKLLDFGLAKLKGDAGGVSPLSQMPTQDPSAPLTAEGTIIGTLQYMAPEQLEGKEADARTDIFAFGAVVYEMVTGKKAFEGKSPASLIGSILKEVPPPVSDSQSISPNTLDRTVKKCLAKDPDDRWQSASDLLDELQWVKDEGSSSGVSVSSPPTSRGRMLVAAVALLVGLGLVAVLGTTWLDPPTPLRPVRIPIDIPNGVELAQRRGGMAFAVSPDGHTLVYAARRDGVSQLYRRELVELDAVAIPGTENGGWPTFSPDGLSIAFGADTVLKRVPLEGGQATTIVDDVRPVNVSWATNDTLVFALGGVGTTLRQAQLSGGMAREITRRAIDAGENDHEWPDLLPGGRHMLFVVNYVTGRESEIVVQSVDANDRRVLIEGTQPRYVPTGHTIFRKEGSLWAVPFDLEGLEIVGTPVPIVEGLSSFAISDGGTLVYAPQPPTAGRVLVWVDEDGIEEQLDFEPGDYGAPVLAPDGSQLAMRVETDGNPDIWIYDLERSRGRRATFDPGTDSYPLWTHDGQRIAFSSARDGGIRNLFWRAADGTGAVERLTERGNIQSPWTWSQDSQTLIFQQENGADWDIYAHAMDTGQSEPLIQSPRFDGQAQVAPTGRWIAYNSAGIWVQPFPNVNDGAWQITSNGLLPKWSPDGRALYYVQRTPPRMMRVSITSGSPAEWGTPQPLFEFDYYLTGGSPSYDVSPTDGRFLMIKDVDDATELSDMPDLVVVLNWFEELKARVPLP